MQQMFRESPQMNLNSDVVGKIVACRI